jgi:hypothetical protein
MNEIILKKLSAGDIVCNNGLERGVKVEATGAATVTVTKADNANRITVIEAIATGSGADNYVLPVPTDVGEEYTFIWGGRAADADNIIFRSESADGLTFSGGLLDIDESDAGFNITFVCTSVGSTPNYAVMGWAASTDTSAAFGDQ